MIGVALLSGGLDSGVAAACFRERDGAELRAAVFCDYGQRAAVPERRAAAALAARWGVALHEVALPWLGELARTSGAALLAGGGALPAATPARPGDQASARA
ncbi:MAG: 7-cyano-7-deazaguanine synthase, partial [Planctomycetes bacterium]|nr:7-cyano-7-deazaguanine synthase [Planctomycetota bacterium]